MNAMTIQSSGGMAALTGPNGPFQSVNRSGDSFASLLEAAGTQSDDEALNKAGSELVSSALLLPVLAQLRDSPLGPKHGPFAPGAAERRFGPLLDEHLADQITHASGFDLVDSIVKRYSNSPDLPREIQR